jgi:hypothetical protein
MYRLETQVLADQQKQTMQLKVVKDQETAHT